MNQSKRLVLIGGGNMGEALLAGLLKSGAWTSSQIAVADLRPEVHERLKKTYHVQVCASAATAVQGAHLIVLAVKPAQMKALLEDIAPVVTEKHLVLSIAAGLTTAFFEARLPKHTPVIRVMPNTPALVGAAASALAPGRHARDVHIQAARDIFSTVGTVELVAEKDLDAVTAVSGSGPAYVFYLAEAMQQAGIQMGLTRAVADRLVRQTIVGAGQLLARLPEEPHALRLRVTSPGGTTEAAMRVFDEAKLRSIFSKALHSARRRSKELSRTAARTSATS